MTLMTRKVKSWFGMIDFRSMKTGLDSLLVGSAILHCISEINMWRSSV